MMVNNLMNII